MTSVTGRRRRSQQRDIFFSPLPTTKPTSGARGFQNPTLLAVPCSLRVVANDPRLRAVTRHEFPAGRWHGTVELRGAQIHPGEQLVEVPGDLVAVGLLEPELARQERVRRQYQTGAREVGAVGGG